VHIYRSLKVLQDDLRSGKTSCTEQVQLYLKRIEDNQHLNAFIEVFEASALTRAAELDAALLSGNMSGRLFGLVIGIKDNIVYAGHASTSGSKILSGFVSPYSATVVERLLSEGAIIIGRLNCDEFAMGSTNESSFYGAVRNPVNPEYVPGGSSGGSAAAVAADLCLASLGSDTGGSIRQPAAFCGVVGVKPTYGRVSRHGLMAYGSSFDQIGPLTHNVEDAALILEAIAGPDDFDATAYQSTVPAYSKGLETGKKYRIAYYKDAIESSGIHTEVRKAAEDLVAQLQADGHILEPVSLKELDYIVPAYYVLTTAEASSNFSRYDGVRYGYRAQDAGDLETTYKRTRSQGFGKEVQRRIMSGTFVLSSGYYDAYYSKAQKVRRLIAEKTLQVLSEYDFILCPAAPTPPFKLGEHINDPIAMYLGDIFTVQANLVGIPAVSLPVASSSEGLPIGMQFMAGKLEEQKLLSFSYQLMQQINK
jgi:aspartyl-tRNA(Asn)/glutamyl-tRNA(Gln) amidotransferase subunit A